MKGIHSSHLTLLSLPHTQKHRTGAKKTQDSEFQIEYVLACANCYPGSKLLSEEGEQGPSLDVSLFYYILQCTMGCGIYYFSDVTH